MPILTLEKSSQTLLLTCALTLGGCMGWESPAENSDSIEYDPQVEIVLEPGEVLSPRPTIEDDDVPDTKLWINERDCKPETISWTMRQEPFNIIERPSEPAQLTASEFLAGSPPLGSNIGQIIAMFPNPKHQAGLAAEGAFQTELFFANLGDDVQISTYHWAPTSLGKLGEIGYTVLVDYRPVETTYTLWSHDRNEILEEVVDTGWTFRRRSNIHIVDLKIGPDAFDKPGAYDVTVILSHHVDHEVQKMATWRYTVLYGGYSLKQELCVREALGEPITEFEREIGRNTRWLIGAFERDSGSTRYAMTHPDGGVWIDWTLFRLWVNRPRIVALVPLVDSKPAAEPIFAWSGGNEGTGQNDITEVLEKVDDRGSIWLDIDGRDKKDVMMIAIPDPFSPIRNLDGEVFYEVGHHDNRHSNIISVSSFRDDSDRCDPQDGPCIEWRY